MKDLLLLAADADAGAFFSSLISRNDALGIRQITLDTDRHPGRDSGAVQSGPELLRMRKGAYQRVLLILDHHGSGREQRMDPGHLERSLQQRLDHCTWTNSSLVVVLAPELERWLWCTGAALARHFGVTQDELTGYADRWCSMHDLSLDQAKTEQPKELFEGVVRGHIRRTLSPRDFAQIGAIASVRALYAEPGFIRLRAALRTWFPA
jgi:hypothetical protein